MWAYNSGLAPSVMGHSSDEIHVKDSGGNPISLQVALDGLYSSSGSGGWRVVAQEDYQSTPTGWNDNTVYTCAGNVILGRHSGELPCLQKTFTNLPSHSYVQVRLEYWFGDAWNYQQGFIKIDGIEVWKRIRDHNYDGSYQCAGGGREDVDIVILSKAHSSDTLNLEICSNLGTGIGTYWYGVDNLEVSVR